MGFATKIVLLALISLVRSDDINLGSEKGRKIYDEDTTANPAIWRQVNNVTITVGDNEVISGLIIKDLREDKKGEAVVVDGGIGQKNMTIELKSPTALRGYEFHIQAYAIPETEADTIKNQGQPHVNSGKTLDTTKTNYPPIPRTATNDGKTTLRNNQPTGSTTLADLAKTETKRSAEVATAKTVPANTASSTTKYPSTKMQDNEATKTTLTSLEKSETKRSADDLPNTKLSTENSYTSSTPQYHATPIKTFDHFDDKNKDSKQSKPVVARDNMKSLPEHQSSLKTSRSVHYDTSPSYIDAKSYQDEISSKKSESPIPVHQFLMNNRDLTTRNKPSDDASVSSYAIGVKMASSATESSKDVNLSSTTKVYTHKPVTSIQ